MKSGSTNLPEGVVHVFRSSSSRPSEEELLNHEAASSNKPSLNTTSDGGVMLGILAVPSWMTPSDLLAFVAPAAEGISHLRIIRFVSSPVVNERIVTQHIDPSRDSVPNRSIAVIKFPKVEDATEFIEAYNGRPFNSMEVRVTSHTCTPYIHRLLVISQKSVMLCMYYQSASKPTTQSHRVSRVLDLPRVPCTSSPHALYASNEWTPP